MRVPTVDEVDRVTTLTDLVVRNLAITQCYYELSLAMRTFTGGSANWCTFATWASKQAGQTIRHEDLARAVQDLADRSPDISAALDLVASQAATLARGHGLPSLRTTLRRALSWDAAFARAADAVARGNKKVFAEIGREFARFLAAFADDAAFDAEKTGRFCVAFRPGGPPDGQHLLSEAFAAYAEARFETDAALKAELTYYGNVLIGLHEQTRLQPEIVEALDAPSGIVGEVKRRVLAMLVPGFWGRIRQAVARVLRRTLPLDAAVDHLAGLVQGQVRQVITQSLMTLQLANGQPLRLGQDLPGGVPGPFERPTLEKLKAVLARLDPTPGSLEGSGARDWADFDERLHFIADFFRVHQQQHVLFDAPFTSAQVAALKAGLRPLGRL